jgi:hypothetical protein
MRTVRSVYILSVYRCCLKKLSYKAATRKGYDAQITKNKLEALTHTPCMQLEPYSIEKGGVLKIRRETFVAGRGNLIIEYPW